MYLEKFDCGKRKRKDLTSKTGLEGHRLLPSIFPQIFSLPLIQVQNGSSGNCLSDSATTIEEELDCDDAFDHICNLELCCIAMNCERAS